MADGGIFVYVSHMDNWEILVLRLEPTKGELTTVQEASVTGKIQTLAVSPDRRFLYGALRTQPYAVASFAIDPLSGRLKHLANAPLPDSMAYLSTDRTGRFLFGASIPANESDRSGLISVSPIGLHGFVQPPHQIIRTKSRLHAILPDPSNRYVFATGWDDDLVLRQIFDAATGRLSPNALSPVQVKPDAGPRHFAFHPNNRFLYLLNETDASIYVFDYDVSMGALSELQIVSGLPPGFELDQEHPDARASDLHLTPDGRFLYASLRTSHTLAAFKVDLSSGLLSPTEPSESLSPAEAAPTEDGPRSFNIDPYGRYLLTVARFSQSMTSYAIDADTGALTKLRQYPMGKGPNWVEIVSLP